MPFRVRRIPQNFTTNVSRMRTCREVGTGAHRELCIGPYLVRVARLAERVANEFAVAVVASVLALMQLHAEHELAPLQLIVIETTCGVSGP